MQNMVAPQISDLTVLQGTYKMQIKKLGDACVAKDATIAELRGELEDVRATQQEQAARLYFFGLRTCVPV